jgi:hypothetical protein
MSGGLILPTVARRWRLGKLELETGADEVQMIQACAAGNHQHPNGWHISAMAVAIGAARELEAAHLRISELEARLERMAVALGATLEELESSAEAELDEPRVEVDLETLEADYRQRIAQARALADGGLGWLEVASRAGVDLASSLDAQPREPTPVELRKIEQWLNQNARARGLA